MNELSLSFGAWDLSAAALLLLAGFAALIKYFFYLLSLHEKRFNKQLALHAEKIRAISGTTNRVAELLHKTREEMKADYVRQQHLDDEVSQINAHFHQVFQKLGALSRDLNQLLGAFNQRVDHSSLD